MDAESILDVDKNALDVEWTKQPKLYFKYAEQLAEARSKIDELKNCLEADKAEIEEVTATLDLAVRNNPEAYSIPGKATETSVKTAITLQPEFKEAKERMASTQKQITEAKSESELLQALVNALDHKKQSLENLVRLHGQNYFSSPTVGDDEVGMDLILEARKRRARTKVGKKGDA